MKGLFKIDAYVPQSERHRYRDFNPFFCRAIVNWDMVGPTMQNIMERQNRKFDSREMLLNPPYCEKLLLPHQYIKWLVEHRIVINKIHYGNEFPYASRPFAQLANDISERRQAAADDPAKEAEGLIMKLVGNALYGTFITNAYDFTTTKLVSPQQAGRLPFMQPVRSIVALSEKLYELTVKK